jgi:hypothetical protein
MKWFAATSICGNSRCTGIAWPRSSCHLDGAGKKKEIEGRIAQIRAQIEETTSDDERQFHAAMQAGVDCFDDLGGEARKDRL